MHASPYIAKKHADGTVTTHYGVSIRSAMLPERQRLLATNDSEIVFRLRQDQPGYLQVMMLTNRPEGAFAGNFECRIQAEELRPGIDGCCELVISLSRFVAVDHGLKCARNAPCPRRTFSPQSFSVHSTKIAAWPSLALNSVLVHETFLPEHFVPPE